MSSLVGDYSLTLCERLRPRDASLNLRPCRATDKPFLRCLNDQDRGPAYAGLRLPRSLLCKLLDAHLISQGDAYAADYPLAEHLIVCRGDAAIGRLSVTLEANRFGQCLRIIDLALAMEVRGRGHARQLLFNLIDRARAMRLARVEASVFAANTRAIRILRKSGFRRQAGVDAAMNVALFYPLP